MTASSLFSISVVATGAQGQTAGTGPGEAPDRQRPYDTAGTVCARRTAERGTHHIHAQPDCGPLAVSRRVPTRAWGRREPRFTGRWGPSSEGGLEGLRSAARATRDVARRGPGCRTTLAFPLRTSTGVPGPRLHRTLGGRRGEGQRITGGSVARLWTGLWTTRLCLVENRWMAEAQPGEALWTQARGGVGPTA